jgi:hypothetical protein
MERWIKAGVIGTFLCAFLQLWSDYRLEHPSQAIQSKNAAAPIAAPSVFFGVLHYLSPIIASVLLFASVWIAFKKGLPKPENEKSRNPSVFGVDTVLPDGREITALRKISKRRTRLTRLTKSIE